MILGIRHSPLYSLNFSLSLFSYCLTQNLCDSYPNEREDYEI